MKAIVMAALAAVAAVSGCASHPTPAPAAITAAPTMIGPTAAPPSAAPPPPPATTVPPMPDVFDIEHIDISNPGKNQHYGEEWCLDSEPGYVCAQGHYLIASFEVTNVSEVPHSFDSVHQAMLFDNKGRSYSADPRYYCGLKGRVTINPGNTLICDLPFDVQHGTLPSDYSLSFTPESDAPLVMTDPVGTRDGR